MDSRAKARLRAERKYMRRTALISAIVAAALFLAVCMLSARYPLVRVRQIESYVRGGEYERALSEISQLDDRDAATRLENAARLAMAVDRMNAGEYDAARETFLALGDYENAASLAQECAWRRGDELFASGDLAGAQAMLLLIPDYPGVAERSLEIAYLQAAALEEADKAAAFSRFQALGDYRDAARRAARLAVELTGIGDEAAALEAMNALSEDDLALIAARETMRPGAVQAGGWHTVGLRSDGRVLAVGRIDEGQCDVDGWTGIVQIAAGALHTAGLRADGTVVAVGSNEQGQCDVGAWRDVVEIACSDWATFARFADGTVAATGYPAYPGLDAWRGVTKLRAGAYMAAGLYGQGSVYATHPSAQAGLFSNLEDLALTTGGAVGLTKTGDVIATFPGFPEWHDMALVSAGNHCVLGVRADGLLFAHFYRFTDACEITQFDDVVSVSAGDTHSVVLEADGRVYAFGNNDYGQCNVEGWKLG
ncbi:MAG: hypothetical protein IKO07_01970 [Clostridia bacterium]|nr:hypothetical protein [Clostridia bacterium]